MNVGMLNQNYYVGMVILQKELLENILKFAGPFLSCNLQL